MFFHFHFNTFLFLCEQMRNRIEFFDNNNDDVKGVKDVTINDVI